MWKRFLLFYLAFLLFWQDSLFGVDPLSDREEEILQAYLELRNLYDEQTKDLENLIGKYKTLSEEWQNEREKLQSLTRELEASLAEKTELIEKQKTAIKVLGGCLAGISIAFLAVVLSK